MGPSERKGCRSTGLASSSVSAASRVIMELMALHRENQLLSIKAWWEDRGSPLCDISLSPTDLLVSQLSCCCQHSRDTVREGEVTLGDDRKDPKSLV